MTRLIRLAAKLYVGVVLLSAPVFLTGLGWAALMLSERSLVLFAIFCVSGINVSLGIAMLIDNRQPQPIPPQDDQ